MRVAGTWVDGPAGYIVCYDIASQNLRLGLYVIADTVNPIHETRQAWREVAESLENPFLEIEVVCSDESKHRHRIATRVADIPGFALPTWEEVKGITRFGTETISSSIQLSIHGRKPDDVTRKVGSRTQTDHKGRRN